MAGRHPPPFSPYKVELRRAVARTLIKLEYITYFEI
jgi:hypothetical protein